MFRKESLSNSLHILWVLYEPIHVQFVYKDMYVHALYVVMYVYVHCCMLTQSTSKLNFSQLITFCGVYILFIELCL